MASRYRRHPLTAGRVVDGRAMVITAGDNKIHTLNDAAGHLWELAKDDGVTVEEAATSLASEYEVELDQAKADVSECFEDLVARGILTVDG